MEKANKLLKIDQNLCLKCGGCVAAYPDIFEADEEGNIKVKENAEIDVNKIPDIKGVCPVSAILDY